MKRVLVLYNRQTIVREEGLTSKGKKRWMNNKYTTEHEVEVEIVTDEDKDSKRMPHCIGTDNKSIELWKFFIKMVNGEMIQLKNPRYMLRVGNDWVKIKEIIEL